MKQESNKKTFYISIQVKLLVGFTLIFSLVFAVAFYWFYSFATARALERITEDLVDTLLAAANGADGDKLQALYTEDVPIREDGYTDDPRYWEQARWLYTVKQIEPRAGLYTYIAGEEPGELIFITSAGALNNPPTGATFLEHWITDNPGPNLSGLITTTLQDTPPGESTSGCAYLSPGCEVVPYGDDWGRWVSAFTPITNSQGEIVAALGMDFKADYVAQVQEAIRSKIVLAFAATYITLFLLVYLVSRFLTRPIIALTGTAEQIGEGQYQASLERLDKIDLNERFPDEIASLSRVFGIMVNKVYQREQTLIHQVETLKIEIDEARRQKQVGEIVETDFFRELQARAEDMRARRKARSQGESPKDNPENE